LSQHPADLVALRDGTLLLTYGNRNPPYWVEGRVSRDGGQTWLPVLLTLSGHRYGYNVTEPRPTDLGYPTSVVLPDGQGVTLYYYTPSLRQSGADRFKLSRLLQRDGLPGDRRHLARGGGAGGARGWGGRRRLRPHCALPAGGMGRWWRRAAPETPGTIPALYWRRRRAVPGAAP
jgi:hypothetical protein